MTLVKKESEGETPKGEKAKKKDERKYSVTLTDRHADWLELQAQINGRSVEHQIEKFIREAFSHDPDRARGATAVKDSPQYKQLTA